MKSTVVHINSNTPQISYNISNIIENVKEIFLKQLYISGIGTTNNIFLEINTFPLIPIYSSTQNNNTVPIILNPTGGIYYENYRNHFRISCNNIPRLSRINLNIEDINGSLISLTNIQLVLEIKSEENF